ncbi:hypothetical protein [Streptomyces sp. SP17KL33]|uniref:hypothetical protein n=1 Tax=Streptomyces sp. SP17KL33 TaxID=3002534 RepID=UPI002E79936B|nr:hypothetical protein [Streptomyces sp. SP17KL33]MEE1835787.1 hypothetical protein [Streptomyces sp. SP17KL33]
MTRFTSLWDTAPTLPDGHLIRNEFTPITRGLLSHVIMRAGHVSPRLLRDLDEYFRHLARTDLLEIVPERAGDPPEFVTNYEAVPASLLPGRTFAVKVTGSHYLFLVRADMMSQSLVDEINDDFLPPQNGLLRTRKR